MVRQLPYTKEEAAAWASTVGRTVNEYLIVLSEDGVKLCVFLKDGLVCP